MHIDFIGWQTTGEFHDYLWTVGAAKLKAGVGGALMCVYLIVEQWVCTTRHHVWAVCCVAGWKCLFAAEKCVSSQLSCGAVCTQRTYCICLVALLAWFDQASCENTPLAPPSSLEEHRLPLLHTQGLFKYVFMQDFASKLLWYGWSGECISWNPLQCFSSLFQHHVPLWRSPCHRFGHCGQWRIPQLLQTQ